jgi:hypothetical protein
MFGKERARERDIMCQGNWASDSVSVVEILCPHFKDIKPFHLFAISSTILIK